METVSIATHRVNSIHSIIIQEKLGNPNSIELLGTLMNLSRFLFTFFIIYRMRSLHSRYVRIIIWDIKMVFVALSITHVKAATVYVKAVCYNSRLFKGDYENIQ